METVVHHDRSTAFRVVERGAGTDPVLFVHGSGGTHEVWKSQFARLSGCRPIVGLDLSGHGTSPDVPTKPGPETMEIYVEDTVAVAEKTGAAVIVGNSLGGAVALTAIIENRLDVEGLVLVGSGATLPIPEELGGLLETDFDRAIRFLHGQDRLFHDPDERVLESSRSVMEAVGEAITRRDFLTCDRYDVREQLDGIEVPTLALTGEHDRLTPPANHEFLAARVENGEWTTLPDAAHISMLETPTAFNKTLAKFLDSVE